MTQINVDAYLVDCLLPDLVGHDRRLVVVHRLSLPLSSRIEGCELVRLDVASVDCHRHWPVPKRGPDRSGTPPDSRAHRDFACSPDRRSPPPRSSTVVAPQRSEELMLRLDPLVDALLEHIQGKRAIVDERVMKFTNVELGAKGFLCSARSSLILSSPIL